MSDTPRVITDTIERNITKLYWMNALSMSGFNFVVYTLFMLSKGFSMQQFFLLGTAKTVASLLAEVPTGMFSDRISRSGRARAVTPLSAPTRLRPK